jgi:AcrR family transcriptional regulator
MAGETKAQQSQRTRSAILRAARARFAADGFERTTIRAVAADARIDPSMVMRYYGSKRGLFAAATNVDLELPDLSGVPTDELGATAVGHFLSRWEGERADDSLRILLASAATNAIAAQQMQEIFRAQLAPVVAAAGPHDPATAAVRAGLVATQMLGFALCRYVLRLPPVVHLERDAVLRWLGPVIQRYLSDPAPDEGAATPWQPSPVA